MADIAAHVARARQLVANDDYPKSMSTKDVESLRAVLAEVEHLAGYIVSEAHHPRDHACAECVGEAGELVVPGFRCGYHVALSLTADAAKGGA